MAKTLLDIFITEVCRCPKLSHEEQVALNEAKTTDPDARHRLILSILPWAIKLAHKYRHTEPLEERISYAMLGVCKAVDVWEPERGKLTTIATCCIHNAIIDAIRKTCHPVVPPNPWNLPRSEKGKQQAECAKKSVELTWDIARHLYADDPIPCELSSKVRQYRAARDALPSRLRKIILAREQGDTLKVIGDRMGLSRERVRQLVDRAIWQIRKAVGK